MALLTRTARVVSLPAGARAFAAGAPCEHYLLLISGTVRVQQVSVSGREIVLYRVEGGESCILTTACLLAVRPYAAEGVTETPVEAVLLPRTTFERLMDRSAVFRRFVFSSYAHRLADLLVLVEEVAFGRLDVRLARCLLERGDSRGRVGLTHQALAVELGSAREVVSRQLKEFERQGWVRRERGEIEIVDTSSLEALASRDGG
ncbi:MAG: Crp/Fnr family transcriptional regulator [Gammaproteobacteria bacterium]